MSVSANESIAKETISVANPGQNKIFIPYLSAVLAVPTLINSATTANTVKNIPMPPIPRLIPYIGIKVETLAKLKAITNCTEAVLTELFS